MGVPLGTPELTLGGTECFGGWGEVSKVTVERVGRYGWKGVALWMEMGEDMGEGGLVFWRAGD